MSPEVSNVKGFSGRRHSGQAQGGHSPHTLIRPSVLRAVAPMRRWAQKKARGFHGYRRQKPAGWVLWMEGQPWRAARDFSRLETRKLIQEKGKPGACHDRSFLSDLSLFLFSRISFLTFLLSVVGVIEDLNSALHKPSTFLMVLNT